jgi:hypothetical protein
VPFSLPAGTRAAAAASIALLAPRASFSTLRHNLRSVVVRSCFPLDTRRSPLLLLPIAVLPLVSSPPSAVFCLPDPLPRYHS